MASFPSQGAHPPVLSGLEGLRGFAVALVVAFHAGWEPFAGGFVGVDVFFVLSGYLITRQLLEEYPSFGRRALARFYVRRLRRIVPAALLVLAATCSAVAVLLPVLGTSVFLGSVLACLAFAANLLYAWRGTDYLNDDAVSPLQHFWSLGVEVQFYIVWPMLMLVASRVGMRRRVLLICAGLALTSAASSVWMTWSSPSWAFFGPLCRAWEFGCGILVAIVQPSGWISRLGPIGLAGIAAAAATFEPATPFPGFAAWLPVGGAALVIADIAQAPSSRRLAFLRVGFVRWLGSISYPVYLWHWPIFTLAREVQGETLAPTVTVALIATTLLLAQLTVVFVERPVRAPMGLPRWQRPASAGVVVVLVVAAACALPAFRSARARVATSPGATLLPSALEPSLEQASTDVPQIYMTGCHAPRHGSAVVSCSLGPKSAGFHVVLFGDSHAAQWFPALEQVVVAHEWRLTVFTKSSCPALELGEFPSADCRSWRESVVKELGAHPPDLIVVSSYGRYIHRPSDAVWAAGLRVLLGALPSRAAKVVIADTPSFAKSPLGCLALNPADISPCSRLRPRALDARRVAAERIAAAEADATWVDLSDQLCSTVCAPVLGNIVVYRDSHHLTVRMSRALAPTLDMHISSALRERGLL